MQYHSILRDYLRDYAIPAMLEQGWALKPARFYGCQFAQRGSAFHLDQPLRTYIINGLYALTRVLEYLKDKEYYCLSEAEFKRTLVLYTMHEAYKDIELAGTHMGNSDYSFPLAELDTLLERMRLHQFVPVRGEDIRAASVSLHSSGVADVSSCTPGTCHLLTLVHLADALASQQAARDYQAAENRLREITVVTTGQDKRMRKSSAIPAQANDPKPPLALYYHELDDYRGLSTLLIHRATEQALDRLGFYPILYFANGILYVGPEKSELDAEELRRTIASNLFSLIQQEAGDASFTLAKQGLKYGQNLKYRKDTYLFSSLNHLIQAIQEYPLAKRSAGFVGRVADKRLAHQKYAGHEDFYTRYSIPINADLDEDLAQRWNAIYLMLMGVENIAGALAPVDTLDWLLSTFNTPPEVANAIKQNSAILRNGGVSDHCLIIAYHWLTSTRFKSDNRTSLGVRTADIQQAAAERALQALAPYDNESRRMAFVNEELGIQGDIEKYLRTHLTFSFQPDRFFDGGPLNVYEKARRRSHKRICVICNREIPIGVKSSDIITDIAEQQALVFSNKLLPSEKVKGQMLWCPMCYLEFMLRKLGGQSYPARTDYNASSRLYLYVLPHYSFTPQLWEAAGQDLLMNFYGEKTVVSKLTLRGSNDEPGLPTRWLEQRLVDQHWLEQVRTLFADQAAHMKTPTQEGKPRGKQGDRLTFSFKNPNYMLITCDNIVPAWHTPAEKSRLTPTPGEMWAKALYAATLIHLLTGARVSITDKPYLNITRPEQMKTIIEMEGLHRLLYGLLPMRRTDAEFTDTNQWAPESSACLSINNIHVALDLLAAVWEINSALYQSKPDERRNLDKQVANVLEEINANYLAGATLFKMRERDRASPYKAFTHACRILLPRQGDQLDEIRHALYINGYELMIDKEGGAMMNLAQRITEASLKLYFPSANPKGRATRFEAIFRSGVETIKSSASIDDDEELVAKVAGSTLKLLERIKEKRGYCPTNGTAQLETVNEFADLLVKQLFSERYGRSISKLTHEGNHMADAIYFLTFQQVNLYWEEKRSKHGNSTSATQHEEFDKIEA